MLRKPRLAVGSLASVPLQCGFYPVQYRAFPNIPFSRSLLHLEMCLRAGEVRVGDDKQEPSWAGCHKRKEEQTVNGYWTQTLRNLHLQRQYTLAMSCWGEQTVKGAVVLSSHPACGVPGGSSRAIARTRTLTHSKFQLKIIDRLLEAAK